MTGFGGLLTGHTLVSRYRIGQVIGRGGFAAVYDAHDERLDRAVAVKVITIAGADGTMDQEIRTRFQREARSSAGLQHRNVVNVFDFGTDPRLGLDFLVMERLRGEDLRSRLRGSNPIQLPEAMHILSGAAAGVAAGHRAGIIHRDVKPGNIFLTETPELSFYRVCVVDFGIALLVAADDTTRLTRNGIPLSVPYASPEQLAGNVELTPASDVFGLGAVGYEMLGGTRPFSGEIARAREERLAPAKRLRELNPDVPEAVEAAIHKALSPKPEDRFPDAEAFGRALGTLERRGEVAVVPTDSSGDSRGRKGGIEDATVLEASAAPAAIGPAVGTEGSTAGGAKPLHALRDQPLDASPSKAALAEPVEPVEKGPDTPRESAPPIAGDAATGSDMHDEPEALPLGAPVGATGPSEGAELPISPPVVRPTTGTPAAARESSAHRPRSRRSGAMIGVAALLIAGALGGTLLLGGGEDAGDTVVAGRTQETDEAAAPAASLGSADPVAPAAGAGEMVTGSPGSAAEVSPELPPASSGDSPPAGGPGSDAARTPPPAPPPAPAAAARPVAQPLPSPGGAEFRENLSHSCQSRPAGEAVPCLQRDLAAADAELNSVYQDVLGRLEPADRESLRVSQRAWLSRYDQVITSYYSTPWGNHLLVEVLPSQIQALRDRTAYLRGVGR